MRKDSARLEKVFWYLVGMLGGVLAGFALWQAIQFFQELLRQPALKVEIFESGPNYEDNLEALSRNIARANLLAGIEKRRLPDGTQKLVVCAGQRNFREPWARDFSFASFGLLEIQQLEAVRETLEAFLDFQAPSGQFPVKLHSTSIGSRYLHSLFGRTQPVTAPLHPKYISAHGAVSLDGQALLVIALLNYTFRSGDQPFAHAHWNALKKGMHWLAKYARFEDGLLYQSGYSDWADSINRRGRVLYTNVVYWKALDAMAYAAKQMEDMAAEEEYGEWAQKLRTSIQSHFWRPDLGYFVTSQQFANLSSSGNLLAIAWDLATPQQSQSILDAIQRFGMADPVPTRPVFPPYPRQYIALENRLGQVAYYHTKAAWLWLGAWHLVALTHAGRLAEAAALQQRLAQVTVREGIVHEVYAPDGHPIANLWYTSEAPFTWSAGMLVYAYALYERHKTRTT